jgi:hypothetical protein
MFSLCKEHAPLEQKPDVHKLQLSKLYKLVYCVFIPLVISICVIESIYCHFRNTEGTNLKVLRGLSPSEDMIGMDPERYLWTREKLTPVLTEAIFSQPWWLRVGP